MLDIVPAQQAADTVDELRKLIVEMDLKPGQRLPPERELTERLGITRNNLRKALDVLERSGAIWRHVGKGTFVATSDADDDVLMRRPTFLGRQLTPFKMLRARLTIEPAIAREAAINASGVALSKMHLAMERAHSAATWALYEIQDDEFHRAVAEASDNLLLLSIFDQLNQVRREVAWGCVTRATAKPPQDHPSFREHEAIAAAIANRDVATAQEAMRDHLRSVAHRLFGEA